MMTHCHTRVRINWGDCDAAGIVFYPHFFRMMDEAFQSLLRERGLSMQGLQARYAVVGTPLLEASATFRSPACCEDLLDIEASVVELSNKTFRVAYTARLGERVIFEGFELRAFVRRFPDGRLGSIAIPEEFKADLQQPGAHPPALTATD